MELKETKNDKNAGAVHQELAEEKFARLKEIGNEIDRRGLKAPTMEELGL